MIDDRTAVGTWDRYLTTEDDRGSARSQEWSVMTFNEARRDWEQPTPFTSEAAARWFFAVCCQKRMTAILRDAGARIVASYYAPEAGR